MTFTTDRPAPTNASFFFGPNKSSVSHFLHLPLQRLPAPLYLARSAIVRFILAVRLATSSESLFSPALYRMVSPANQCAGDL
jgi:hypothetical protein